MKRAAIVLLTSVSMAALLAAQSLAVRIEGDQLRITAPRVHLIVGDALSRLRDGATVRYELQLTARNDRIGRVIARTQERFAISYDLWEEKFAVTKLGTPGRSISHLSAAAADAWCVDNVSLPIASLSAGQQLWIRLDYQADDSAGPQDPQDNSGFTLSGLVDIFSRRTRSEPLHGSEEAGPVRFDSLKKK